MGLRRSRRTMGQVLGFAHCKESASTVSTTPDSTPSSTDGGNDESDFPDLQTAREFSEDEEETSLDWGTPQLGSCELTFSYITFAGGIEGDDQLEPRRDSFARELTQSDRENRVKRQRRPKPSGLIRTETAETLLPDLCESLSYSSQQYQSPDIDNQFCPEVGKPGAEGQDSFIGWDPTIGYIDEPEFLEGERLAGDVQTKEEAWKYSKGTRPEAVGMSPFEKGTGEKLAEVKLAYSEEVPEKEVPSESREESKHPCIGIPNPLYLPFPDSGDHPRSVLDAPSDLITEDSGHKAVQPRTDSSFSEALPQPGATVYMDILSKGSPHSPPTFTALSDADGFSQEEEDKEDWSENEPITALYHASYGQSGKTLEIRMLVADLLYWKDLKTSAIVFTGLMLVLLSLSQFSVISVLSYLALLLLCVTVSLRVYKKILQALHKSDGANPFQVYLDVDITVSKEQFQKYLETTILYFTSTIKELRRLILVEDLIDSIKFAVLMWLLTYIGAVFNGLTLLILAVISVFTIPLLYRQHQAQIDQYVGLVRAQISDIRAKIQAKLPSAKPKTE